MAKKYLLWSAIVTLLLTPAFASAATQLYVSPSGSDSGSCTSAAPCQLNRANELATPGTTIYVAPGSYASNAVLSTSGTASQPIRWLSTEKWGADISGNTSYGIRVAGNYVDVEGFNVTGGAAMRDGISLQGSRTRAIGNLVHDIPRACISGNGGIIITGADAEVIGNFVRDIGIWSPGTCEQFHGIYSAAHRTKIINNVVTRVLGDGITSWHNVTDLTIVNNTVDKAGYNGIVLSSNPAENPGGNKNGYIANNIVTNSWGYGIKSGNTTNPAHSFINNTLFNNGSGNAVSTDSSSTVSGTQTTNPLFVNAAADNYQLTASSPSINSGTSQNAPSTDSNGVSRPQGAGVDRGAYEYGGTAPPPPGSPPPTPPTP